MWTLASARRYWGNVFCIATGIKVCFKQILILINVCLLVFFRKLRSHLHHRILFGFSITLLIFLTLFTVMIFDDNLEKSVIACKSIAIMLHYLLLCAFMWMSVDATFLYKQVVIVFDDRGDRQRKLILSSVVGEEHTNTSTQNFH